MKVKGTRKEYVDVEVDPLEVVEQLERRWEARVPGRIGQHIWNGRWQVDYHTSHSWSEDKGELTEEETEIHQAFGTIKKLIKSRVLE